jgi:hypothetical protein
MRRSTTVAYLQLLPLLLQNVPQGPLTVLTPSSRLTRTRCARIARALEASEHPDEITSQDAVIEVWNEVKGAIRAARRIDPTGRTNKALHGELDRRLRLLAGRLDTLTREDRRSVVAQVLSLATIGRAAGYAVRPQARDLQRAPSLDGDFGALTS